MKEIVGNLWDYYGKTFYCTTCLAPEGTDHRYTHSRMIGTGRADTTFVVCITTNGTVKANGEAVMGRGCAWEAKQRWPWLPKYLGDSIKEIGNLVQEFRDPPNLITFPVKHHWMQQADLELIERSARRLKEDIADFAPNKTFMLPRPGCGNGRLTWFQVKPMLEPILPDNVWIISPRP